MRFLPWLLALALVSCQPDFEPVPPGCGNGLVDLGEECDAGPSNSDDEPDTCRSSCLLPVCGDGVADRGEDCDDGDEFGGDGCTPLCEIEHGQLEDEPNDEPDEAQDWELVTIHGGLPEGDVDCFSLELPNCAAVWANLVGECPAPALLALHDPEGNQVAVGSPDASGCAALDPAAAPGARFVAEGSWTVCVSALLDGPVPYYALEIGVVQPEDASYTIDEADDPDGDGKPDKCDTDRDGDGVENDGDSCPDVPNGPDSEPLTPSDDGFLRVWLSAGPYTGLTSEQDCLPTADNLVAEVDADATPGLGDPAGGEIWTVLWSGGDRLEYLDDYGHVDAPREVYNAVYLYSGTERTLTLGHGPDDGARTWFNGEEVQTIDSCQGTVVDAFPVDVTFAAGWNRLMTKVYDQGGGWGNYVRFLDGGVPVTDLEVSLDPAGPWIPDQTDSDGDGEGDVCDDTP